MIAVPLKYWRIFDLIEKDGSNIALKTYLRHSVLCMNCFIDAPNFDTLA